MQLPSVASSCLTIQANLKGAADNCNQERFFNSSPFVELLLAPRAVFSLLEPQDAV